MAQPNDTHARMVDAGEQLLSERGYSNVTMLEVIDHAQAPRGSIYYHFPGGKEELALRVVAKVVDDLVRYVAGVAERTAGAEEFLVRIVDHHRRHLERSAYRLGCPLMGIAVNTGTQSEPLRAAVAGGFARWIDAVARGLMSKGVAPEVARRAAAAAVSGIEGAIVVGRATRTTTAFDLLAEGVPGLLGA